MKIVAKLIRILNIGNKSIVEFEVPTYQLRDTTELFDKELVLTIKDKKEARTDSQRRYAWALITEIDKKFNGYKSDLESTYKGILGQANIKPIYLEGLEEIKDSLAETFRIVEVVENRKSLKGKETVLYKCHKGISLLTKEEMIDFIEVLLFQCAELGIETEIDMFVWNK